MSVLKDRRMKIYVVCMLLLGVLPLALRGIDFGMDFKGGSSISIKLDKKADTQEMQAIVAVLQSRVNAYGLKDVAVKPWGNEYVLIEVAETDTQAVNQLQALLGQEGKFEALFEGKIILSGQDIVSVVTNPQKGYGARQSGRGYEWQVPFLMTGEAADSFASAVSGRCTPTGGGQCEETVAMFIDRPANAVLIITSNQYEVEKTIPQDFESSTATISLEKLVEESGAQFVVADSLSEETLTKVSNKTVIMQPDSFNTTLLEQYAAKVVEKQAVGKYWAPSALGAETIVHLTPEVTSGAPVTNPTITGFAVTLDKAKEEMNRIVILLKSGKLPVAVSVGGVSTISPVLGADFLYYTGIAGLLAMLGVSVVLFFRYRKPGVTIPIMWTSVSEVVLILGVAALIGWQLDLASMAGIIAAIGTGVNDQIIIIDEVLRKEVEAQLTTVQKIKRAFSTVVMAAGTIIFAMLPLLFIGLGMLKGFAITTIIGVIVGIAITRPAYAAFVQSRESA